MENKDQYIFVLYAHAHDILDRIFFKLEYSIYVRRSITSKTTENAIATMGNCFTMQSNRDTLIYIQYLAIYVKFTTQHGSLIIVIRLSKISFTE